MKLVYNFSLFCYYQCIKLAALCGHSKALDFIKGRRNIYQNIPEDFSNPIWFHVSSLGEYEQARPIIESIQSRFPNQKIILTFYSPSGYNHVNIENKNILKIYSPWDTKRSMGKFLTKFNPSCLILTKYDLWYHMIQAVSLNNLPIILHSGLFYPNQIYFKCWGEFFKSMLKNITIYFVQNQESKTLLENIGINSPINITGDCRVETVLLSKITTFNDSKIEQFIEGAEKIWVAGSTWKSDDLILVEYFKMNHGKIILAPHHIDDTRIEDLLKIYQPLKVQKYSDPIIEKDTKILILNQIGKLKYIYRYGHYAYIGGGFQKGIHNSLEAAVYNMPVFFGPQFQKFEEAKNLVKNQLAFSIRNVDELKKQVELFNSLWVDNFAQKSKAYFQNELFTSEEVINYLCLKRVLTAS